MRRKEMHINAAAVAAIAPASPSSSSSSTATNKKSIHVEYAIIYIEMNGSSVHWKAARLMRGRPTKQ